MVSVRGAHSREPPQHRIAAPPNGSGRSPILVCLLYPSYSHHFCHHFELGMRQGIEVSAHFGASAEQSTAKKRGFSSERTGQDLAGFRHERGFDRKPGRIFLSQQNKNLTTIATPTKQPIPLFPSTPTRAKQLSWVQDILEFLKILRSLVTGPNGMVHMYKPFSLIENAQSLSSVQLAES